MSSSASTQQDGNYKHFFIELGDVQVDFGHDSFDQLDGGLEEGPALVHFALHKIDQQAKMLLRHFFGQKSITYVAMFCCTSLTKSQELHASNAQM